MQKTESQTGRCAEVNGLNMYYEIHGQGKPLVLIHGAASTIQSSFGRLIPEMAKSYQLIGVELQAHGHSDNRDGRQISFEQDAADVVSLLQLLRIDNASFFGFSNGGTTAVQIAIQYPLLVNKIVFASSMFKRKGAAPAFWEGFKNPDFKDMPDVYKQIYKAINPDPGALLTMFNQCVNRMLHFRDIPDSLIQQIKAPTLIILGDHDVPLPEHAVEMYRLLPYAHLAIFPGGHGDYMGEIMSLGKANDPPDALPVILDFLAR
jgi:pimeloyl-ACP methyl ester carboxylesterase